MIWLCAVWAALGPKRKSRPRSMRVLFGKCPCLCHVRWIANKRAVGLVHRLETEPASYQELHLAPLLNVGHLRGRELAIEHHHFSAALGAKPGRVAVGLAERLSAIEANIGEKVLLVRPGFCEIRVMFECLHCRRRCPFLAEFCPTVKDANRASAASA